MYGGGGATGEDFPPVTSLLPTESAAEPTGSLVQVKA